MILAIISHTEHFKDANGQIVGWGATVREINHLTEIFEKVIHIAPLYEGKQPAGMLRYESSRIEFVPLKPAGGESLLDKLGILWVAPYNYMVVKKTLKRADVFQFRAPTGMGVYLIPYLLNCNKKGWFKYAGNWAQLAPPMGYAIQRNLLKKQDNRIVTINGHWPDQKQNQLTFENPCLTKEERFAGKEVIQQKDYSGKLDFVFVGRLEDEKGVQRILNVFSQMQSERIGTIHFVGDGPKRKNYEQFVNGNHIKNVVFHGYLPRTEINVLLTKSHVFLLPSSASEGFPKVIAEAANYGLIPVVSDVSSIAQYIIDGQTGFIVQNADEVILQEKVLGLLDTDTIKIKAIADNAYLMAEDFTYDHYQERILNDILKNDK